MNKPAILWLRRDLRRHDHPALLKAHEDAGSKGVLPLFVIDPVLWKSAGPARRGWLAATLKATTAAYGDRLVIRLGDPATVVPKMAKQVGAEHVHVTRETTPYGARRDERLAETLAEGKVELVATGTPYAVGPGLIVNGGKKPYKVFTPFSKAWREHGWPEPAKVDRVQWADAESDQRVDAMIEKAIREAPELPDAGEDAAMRRWHDFLADIDDYGDDRNRPDYDATSRLSPYLKYGVLHPRTLLADLKGRRSDGATTWVTEIAWREFYADVLHHHPQSAWHDLNQLGIPYDDPDEHFDAWCEGRTGFPIVDAGMRQLNETGWMHNRVRMITASFLTKDLHVWWPHGARYFLDRLIDGDIASNNHGWQWVAGTGTDAAPYFRVFNPTTQGEKFDPKGDYVRRWIPQLRHIEGKAVHQPEDRGDYPEPIVDHKHEREETLKRYEHRH